MTNRPFCEEPRGFVRHTAVSRHLTEDSIVQGSQMSHFPASQWLVPPLATVEILMKTG